MPYALLCGDFNLSPQAPAHALILEHFCPLALINQGVSAIDNEVTGWQDAWQLVHGDTAHAPISDTLGEFDHTSF